MSFLPPNRHVLQYIVLLRPTLILACVLLSCPGLSRANDFSTVVEIIKTHCHECHNSETKEGGLNLAGSGTNLHDAQLRTQWTHVFDRVRKKEMPPAPQELPEAHRDQLLQILEPLLNLCLGVGG